MTGADGRKVLIMNPIPTSQPHMCSPPTTKHLKMQNQNQTKQTKPNQTKTKNQ